MKKNDNKKQKNYFKEQVLFKKDLPKIAKPFYEAFLIESAILICILYAGFNNIRDLMHYSKMDKSKFEVKLAQSDVIGIDEYEHSYQYYALFIDGKESNYDIDYNRYMVGNIDLNYLAKYQLINEIVCNLIFDLFMCVIAFIAASYACKIMKSANPFARDNLKYLRYLSINCIAVAFVPFIVNQIIRFKISDFIFASDFGKTTYFGLIGLIFIFLEFIFKYAISIKEDNDLIA